MESTNTKLVKLALLVSISTSQISLAQNMIAPYFPGLSEGVAVSESCSSYQDYSINVIENEGDQQFDLYKGTDCKGEKTIYWF
jgi:hypothetical protein